MKVAAHPLVVAVALGLVAPDALEVSSEPSEAETVPCEDCSATSSEVWSPGDAPSAEEFHRVELAWLAATHTDSHGV